MFLFFSVAAIDAFVFAKYLTFVGRELQVNITHLQFHKGQRSAFIKNEVWMEQRVGFSPSLYDLPEGCCDD